MPMHDWSKVEAGMYHDFHYSWIATLKNVLNAGRLPKPFLAMAEQYFAGREGDILTLHRTDRSTGADIEFDPTQTESVGLATLVKPTVSTVIHREAENYARKANRIVIRKRMGKVVAVIELVSPGNKHSQWEMDRFVAKGRDLLAQGIHLLVIDPFPPTKRDPDGLHPLIWDDPSVEPYSLPRGKNLSAISYDSEEMTAYLEPFAVGEELPTMPLFFQSPYHVDMPLEETYMTTWNAQPEDFRRDVLASGQA